MKTILQTLCIVVCFCFTSTICQAQLPNGAVAPLWTLTDIDGNTHDLQSILDQGKTVVLDFSATWCGPCWSYHNSGALEGLHDNYGPDGTDEFFVMMIEGDTDTELACLYGPTGCTGGTTGNWVQGTNYPIMNVTTESVVNDYQIGYWPTIYTICPDGFIYESGQVPTAVHYSWKQSCDFDASLVGATGMQCYEDKTGTADIDVVGGAGTISYNWSNGQSTQDLVDAYPGNYSCIATEGNGRTITILDVIVPGPTSELLTTLNNATDVVCHGEGNGTINIDTEGGTPNYSFLWSNGSVNEDLSGLGQGTYTLLVTDNNACTKEIEVDIVDPDPVEATVATTVENCGGNDASITVDGQGGTGGLTYTYGPETNQTGIFNNVSAGNYTVIVRDNNNCEFSEAISIDEIPNPEVEVFPADPLSCSTTTVTLSAAADVGPDFSYVWSTSNGNIVSGVNSLTPVVDAPGLYQILVINETNGCFSQASVTVDGSGDLPTIAFEAVDQFTCSTTEIIIDASNSSNGSDYTYEWTTTDGVIISGNGTDMIVVSKAGIYTLELTNTTTGCTNTSSVEVLEDPDVPTAEISAPPAIDCDHLSIVLDGSSSSQGQDYVYEWTTDDGVIISAVDDEATVGSAGTYTLTVINSNTGCSSDYQIIVEDESVEVGALWVYQAIGLSVNIEDLTSGTPTHMTWDMGNGEIIDGSINAYVYAEPGVYEVCLVAGNGCGDDQYCLRVVVNDKVKETLDGDFADAKTSQGKPIFTREGAGNDAGINQDFDVSIFPNPTTGNFAINLSETRMVESYQLVDMNGRTMLTNRMNAETTIINLDASQINNGTYFIQIQLDNEVIVKQVVIMK